MSDEQTNKTNERMNETKDFYVTMEWATKYTTFFVIICIS